VLSDSAAIGRGKTSRVAGKKYNRNECRGFYHPSWRGDRPWIELVVDNIIKRYPRGLLRFQFFRDVAIGKTLYHEVGHHLHETIGSATAGGEDAAHDWQRRLAKLHGRKRFWYLRPLRPVLIALAWLLRGGRRRKGSSS
jgi:hypothetical protein